MFNPQDFLFSLFNGATQEGGDITLKIILIPQVLLPRFLIRYCLIPYYPMLFYLHYSSQTKTLQRETRMTIFTRSQAEDLLCIKITRDSE